MMELQFIVWIQPDSSKRNRSGLINLCVNMLQPKLIIECRKWSYKFWPGIYLFFLSYALILWLQGLPPCTPIASAFIPPLYSKVCVLAHALTWNNKKQRDIIYYNGFMMARGCARATDHRHVLEMFRAMLTWKTTNIPVVTNSWYKQSLPGLGQFAEHKRDSVSYDWLNN